jgi:ribosomal-protein-alanine N-acetyltransferase
MKFEIKRLTAEDIPFITVVEKKCFSSPWSERSFKASFNSPSSLWFGAFCDGNLIGFCGAQIVAPEGEIINIAVDPQFRRNGAGEILLREMLNSCHEVAQYWFLDVRESNIAAQALYKKLGFFAAGKRIDYYTKPREDAVVMKLDLSNRRPCDADSFI